MWATWEQYQAAHPSAARAMTSETFTELAAAAARLVEFHTYHRAQLATSEEETSALAECQMDLVTELYQEAQEDQKRGGSDVTSASNDGYSESYASAADTHAERERRIRSLVYRDLSGPSTMWMIYAGGVFHRPGRC